MRMTGDERNIIGFEFFDEDGKIIANDQFYTGDKYSHLSEKAVKITRTVPVGCTIIGI